MVELIEQNFEENKKAYNRVEKELKQILGENAPIDHVGSTAIPDMVGKNIIDVLVGAKDKFEFEQMLKKIEQLGFYASQNSKSDIYQFFASRTGETGEGDTHIHLVIINTERYNEFIFLRDFLLANPDEAKNYSDHKKQLLANGVSDRKEYRATKSKYVTDLIQRAKDYNKKNR